MCQKNISYTFSWNICYLFQKVLFCFLPLRYETRYERRFEYRQYEIGTYARYDPRRWVPTIPCYWHYPRVRQYHHFFIVFYSINEKLGVEVESNSWSKLANFAEFDFKNWQGVSPFFKNVCFLYFDNMWGAKIDLYMVC